MNPNHPPRFRYRERQLTTEEAHLNWQDDLDHLIAVRDAAQRDLDNHLQSSLVTVVVEQIELHLGDDGYEEAPVGFQPALYQGSFAWANTTSKPPTP